MPDLEVWLSSLAEPQPFLDGEDTHFNRALFRHVSNEVAVQLRRSVGGALAAGRPPSWLVELVRGWHRCRATVVTFNYDTLVEATFNGLELVRAGNYPTKRYLQLPPASVPYWYQMAVGWTLPPAESFTLLNCTAR